MKKRSFLYSLLAVAMIVLMAVIVSPVNTYADEPDPGVSVSKEITVLDNGTYVLDLEAFATGEVTTTTTVKPCDIVLVLDASSSMGMSQNVMEDGTYRIQALVDAANAFLKTVAEKNAENAEAGASLSTVAIVLFSDSNNTATLYNFTEITNQNLISNSVYATYENRNYVTEGVGTNGRRFELHNTTYTDKAMSTTDTLLTNLTAQQGYDKGARNRVVVLFTDGYPNHNAYSPTDFTVSAARDVINTARTIKTTHQASVFSVAILGNNAKPELDPETTGTGNSGYGSTAVQRVNQMLHAASSNYPQARNTATGTNGWTMQWGTGGNYQGGYYKSAKTASDLKNIFTDIAESSASSQTPLTAESVMKDIVSSSFTLPKGANVNTIEVTIVPWDMTNHSWSSTGYTPAQWTTACTNYGAEAAENVTITLSEDQKTIDVSGFDYGTHFLATTDTTQDALNKNSAKVHIHFPIQAKPSSVTGGEVETNGPESGIYIKGTDSEPYIAFPQPKVTFTPVTYVVDYVTSDTTHDTKVSTVKLEYKEVLDNVEMLDDPSDDYLIGIDAGDFEYTIYKGTYGTISFGDDELDVQRRYVRYAPTTMNWDGYDRIFVKGASATSSDLDVWAMLCVIPANSVFYEDTFITQTKTVTYNEQSVNIEYTGINYSGYVYDDEGHLTDTGTVWSTVGTEGANSTQHAGDDMGWIRGLADDSAYANDMAHTAKTAQAKATFTVSGTGVDIYSRTNGSTGTVKIGVVSLAGENESGKRVGKTKIIDTKAAAGDFFAIPVCTFTDLPYGKYTVTITVTAAAKAEGRMTFFLDGVRVYNPIKPLEEEENVQIMYGEENLGAVFTEVRSLLLSDPAQATAAAFYIDEHTVNSETVPDVAAIEAAAKALSEAQAARDKYVEENITPAKNELIDAQYAVPEALTALNNATTVYNAAKAAYDAAVAPGSGASEAEIQAAKDAMDEKEDLMDAAQTAYDTAVATYTDAYIQTLEAAVETAINGRAGYDAEIEAKRQAYETASQQTIDVSYNTTDIKVYTAEGPKSEVYLSKDQSVTINVEEGKTYYVGLKSIDGRATSAMINNQLVTYKIGDTTYDKISHTTDLYYEATPAAGAPIVIKNTGDGILAITKLRTTGVGNTTNGTKLASAEETLNYVRRLNALAATDYTGNVLTKEEAESVVDEFAVAEETEEMLEESDITIENPEPEPEAEVPEETQTIQSAPSIWSKLLSSFAGFFRR